MAKLIESNWAERRRARWLHALIAVSLMTVRCGGRTHASATAEGTGGSGARASGTVASAVGGVTTGGSSQTADRTSCPRAEAYSDLPDCAYIDGCRLPGQWYVECAPSDDCTVTFEAGVPEMPVYALSLCGEYDEEFPSSPRGSWTLDADRRHVTLGEAACALWRGAQSPQLVFMSEHSCIR